MVGRKPLGPALVTHLNGSASAKERLELILATIAGKTSVVGAAERLGISEAMFYKLRNRALQVTLDDLEPKPLGRPAQRPSAETQLIEELNDTVAELKREVAVQNVRLELAQAMPQTVAQESSAGLKKTTQRKPGQKKPRRSRRKRK